MVNNIANTMPGIQAQSLLEEIASWSWVTTIIIHGGSVFEFKGPFPSGSNAEGFYNLEGDMPGFHGHLNLNRISHITFQDKAHRGKESYAFVFENEKNDVIFKVFLGRTDDGELISEQVERFKQLQSNYLEQN